MHMMQVLSCLCFTIHKTHLSQLLLRFKITRLSKAKDHPNFSKGILQCWTSHLFYAEVLRNRLESDWFGDFLLGCGLVCSSPSVGYYPLGESQELVVWVHLICEVLNLKWCCSFFSHLFWCGNKICTQYLCMPKCQVWSVGSFLN